MAKLKAALVVGALAVSGVTAYSLLSPDEEVAGTKNLVNQVWVERMPQNQQDMIAHMVVLDQDGHQFGIIGRSSTWRHFLEVFGWRLENDRLKLFFPQERQRAEVKARTWRCKGEAPEPFELCLELRQNDRSLKFYSRKDWVVKDAESLESLTVEVPELAGIFDGAKLDMHSPIDGEDFVEGALPL